jgi:hypothetical protein
MFYTIERKDQLNALTSSGDCFVHFIPLNNNIHPKLNSLSLVYIRYLNDHKGYILCLKHNESFSLGEDDVLNYLREKTSKMFTLNKKNSLYYFPFADRLFDLNFINAEDNGLNNRCIDWYYKNCKYKNINCLIPISKHYEYCEALFELKFPIIQQYNENNLLYKFNNTILTEAFYNIENKGIKLDKEKYLEYFENNPNPEYNIFKGLIYSSYNLYTTTGRPSCRFNSLNFAALNKSNGEREIFIPQNNSFIELDYEGYHPRLIGNEIGYNFSKDESVHIQLGKLYFKKDEINDEEYKQSKEITFQQLYGGVRKEYQDNPFFKKVIEYVDNIWNQINKNGFINTINKTFFLNQIENPTPQKVFNYIIQNLETTNNTIILKNIHEYLKYKKTKLVLYTYDAFLFDYALSDGKDTLQQIQQIMKYPSTIKRGKNYNLLEKLHIYNGQ